MGRAQARAVDAVGRLVAVAPLLVLAGVYSYAVRAYLLLGSWPYRSHPQSWRLFPGHFALLEPFVYVLFLPELPFIALVAALVLGRLRRQSEQTLLRLWLGATVVFFLVVLSDPAGLIEWFLD